MQDKLYFLPVREPTEPEYRSTYPLPVQLTPLLGREQEEAAVCTLLRREEVRLLTLTGPGGIGKTRLALLVATDLLDDFADGVCFVSLAPISNPALVLPTIAQALDLKEVGEQLLSDRLKAFLYDKDLLLLLDNFEQVVTAAPLLIDLLVTCPEVKLLVTSRAVLHVQGEHEFPVPPLAVPNLTPLPSTDTLSHYTAVALFLRRAQAIQPTFKLTNANARAVAEICVRLDGLPLAIELAAARIKLLPPQALLARLGQRLQMLTGGARDAPARQQTLRNTIEWSYQLLDAQEQRLLQRLSVFVGGCTLEAIEAVCTALETSTPSMSMLDSMASLLDKSLLQQREQEGGEPRFLMLETIREYGLEMLEAYGEAEATRQAHAAYYLRLTEEAELELHGPQQTVWLARLEQEYDNLRTAFGWTLAQREGEGAEQRRELALRLAGALQVFWVRRGHLSEGWFFLKQALEKSEGITSAVQAKGLVAASYLVTMLGDLKRAASLGEEGLRLYQQIGDRRGVACSLYQLGLVAISRSDFVAAGPLLEEAVTLFKEVGDRNSIAWSLMRLACVNRKQGQFGLAEALYQESLRLFRELGDKEGMLASLLELSESLLHSQVDLVRIRQIVEESLMLSREIASKFGLAYSLGLLAELALWQDDPSMARSRLEESMALFKELGCQDYYLARQLLVLAKAHVAQGDYTAARALYEESLAIAMDAGDKLNILSSLEGLAQVVANHGEFVWAARLWGAAKALRQAINAPLPPVERADYERSVAAARASLGEKAFASAWTEGCTMTPEHVLVAQGPATMVLPTSNAPSTLPAKTPTYPAGLTTREVEVLRLVAQGLTDTQVAEQLVISVRTVNWHLTSIYSKLQVSSRSAATRYAIEHQLV